MNQELDNPHRPGPEIHNLDHAITNEEVEEEMRDYERIHSVLDELQDSGVTVTLSRKKIDDDKYKLIDSKRPISDFSVEWVKSEFGGGSYEARFFDSQNKHRKRARFEIDEMFEGRRDRIMRQRKQGSGADNSAEYMALMMDVMKTTQAEQASKRETSASNMIALATVAIPAITGLIESMMRHRDTGSGLSSRMEDALFRMMEQRERGRSPELMEQLEFFREIKEIVGAEDKEQPHWFLQAIEKMAPALQTALGGGGAMAALPAGQSEPQPKTQPQTHPGAQGSNGVQGMMISRYLTSLLHSAKSDDDTDTLHDQILQIVPETYAVKILLPTLRAEDWLTKLYGNRLPEAERFRTWFEELRGKLVASLSSAAEEGGEPDGKADEQPEAASVDGKLPPPDNPQSAEPITIADS